MSDIVAQHMVETEVELLPEKPEDDDTAGVDSPDIGRQLPTEEPAPGSASTLGSAEHKVPIISTAALSTATTPPAAMHRSPVTVPPQAVIAASTLPACRHSKPGVPSPLWGITSGATSQPQSSTPGALQPAGIRAAHASCAVPASESHMSVNQQASGTTAACQHLHQLTAQPQVRPLEQADARSKPAALASPRQLPLQPVPRQVTSTAWPQSAAAAQPTVAAQLLPRQVQAASQWSAQAPPPQQPWRPAQWAAAQPRLPPQTLSAVPCTQAWAACGIASGTVLANCETSASMSGVPQVWGASHHGAMPAAPSIGMQQVSTDQPRDRSPRATAAQQAARYHDSAGGRTQGSVRSAGTTQLASGHQCSGWSFKSSSATFQPTEPPFSHSGVQQGGFGPSEAYQATCAVHRAARRQQGNWSTSTSSATAHAATSDGAFAASPMKQASWSHCRSSPAAGQLRSHSPMAAGLLPMPPPGGGGTGASSLATPPSSSSVQSSWSPRSEVHSVPPRIVIAGPPIAEQRPSAGMASMPRQLHHPHAPMAVYPAAQWPVETRAAASHPRPWGKQPSLSSDAPFRRHGKVAVQPVQRNSAPTASALTESKQPPRCSGSASAGDRGTDRYP